MILSIQTIPDRTKHLTTVWQRGLIRMRLCIKRLRTMVLSNAGV
jgi:hypothetical protein